MRTTVTLDEDVARAVDELRREQGLSASRAVNALARRGLNGRDRDRVAFTQTASSLGRARIPLDDVGAVLEVLEGEAHRG